MYDSVEDLCSSEFSAHWFSALVRLVSDDEFVERREGTVGIVHSLFEEVHASAKEDSVLFAGGLCEVEEVLNTRVFIDLLKDLCGKGVDRHDVGFFLFLFSSAYVPDVFGSVSAGWVSMYCVEEWRVVLLLFVI